MYRRWDNGKSVEPAESYVNRLPDEILIIILKELPADERVRSGMHVSQRWKSLIQRICQQQKVVQLGHCDYSYRTAPKDVIPDQLLPGILSGGKDFIKFNILFSNMTTLITDADISHVIHFLPEKITHLRCRLSAFHKLNKVPCADSLKQLYVKTTALFCDPDQGIYGCRDRDIRLSFPSLTLLVIVENVIGRTYEWGEFFAYPPALTLNRMLPDLPHLTSLGLQVTFHDDRCLTAVGEWIMRIPKLKSLCLSGLYRGLVDGIDEDGKRGALDIVVHHLPNIRILFMDSLLLNESAINKLNRLRKLVVYGTKVYNDKYVRVEVMRDELIAFTKSAIAKKLVHICFRYEADDEKSEEILQDKQFKHGMHLLRKTGRMESCRMGKNNIIDSFVDHVRRSKLWHKG